MNAHGSEIAVAGDMALTSFREGLSGPHALDLLQQASGRLLIQLAVGVGKSEWMARIIVHALTTDSTFDLVVVLVPRWDILHELVDRLPADLPRTILTPRPRKQCGDLDEIWTEYESTGCALLAKEQVCRGCPLRMKCSWPEQYSSGLRGVRLVLATQQHLALDPQFLRRLFQQVGADRPLVLLDESDFLARNVERTIPASDLQRFIVAQQMVLNETESPSSSARRWLELTDLVSQAPTEDLKARWPFPFVGNQWALDVQKVGRQKFGPSFRFLGFDLHHLQHSDIASRERLATGDLRFAVPTYLGKDFMIFSGSMAKELARYRLDPNHARPTLVSPFEHHRFEHSETHWYNLNMLAGAAKFFPKNADYIFDFFAHKILRNIQDGKRTLLIARKKFKRLCQVGLRKRLVELGAGTFKIVTGNWKRHDLMDPRVLPLINYGVSGLNRFQHCEAAYCLTGYYVSPTTLSQAVQDMDSTIDRFPITIDCGGNPRRREAKVHLPDERQCILPCVAANMLEQLEADVIVQAVGRVRPFTKPREIITFHMGDLPGVKYRVQFTSLEQARRFFGIPTAQTDRMAKIERAKRLKVQGQFQKDIAKELGVSARTIRRYLKV